MRAGVALVSCVALAAIAAGVPHASPIEPNFDIYSIGLNGGAPQRLTSDPADELSPSMSPDGATIAFSRGRDLWLMRPDGTGQRLLAAASDEVSYRKPVWSANGRFIAFTAWDYSACYPGSRRCVAPSVGVVQPDGSGLRTIRSWAMSPRWSPRGQRLAVAGDASPYNLWPTSIYSLSLAGSGPKLAHARDGLDSPSWSPDGRKLVYTRLLSRDPAVYVVRADRPGSRRLRRGEHPEWSPRGDRIAFIRRSRLYLVRAHGRARAKEITFANWYSWSPRGDRLALVDFRLSVIRPDGRSFRILCCDQHGFGDDPPAWSQTRDRIFYAFKRSG